MSHVLRDIAPIRAGRCATCTHWARPDEVTPCRLCECPHHVAASAYNGNDPASPVGAEAALQAFMDALDGAREALEAAMNDEVDAELARDAAKRRWLLTDECQALRTVSERKAWAEDRIADQERTFRLARAKREAAKAVLDVLGKQLSAQQSINRSVTAAYQGTGDRW